jgi:hypothetical protein
MSERILFWGSNRKMKGKQRMRISYLFILVVLVGRGSLMAGETTNIVPQEEAQALATNALKELMACDDYKKLNDLPAAWSKLPASAKRILLLALSDKLTSTQELKLENIEDMVVMSRLQAGKMKWHMHGVILRQDVFMAGGRCAWAIEKVLGSKLPSIEADMEAKELEERVRTIKEKIKQSPLFLSGSP